eukprot:UN32475
MAALFNVPTREVKHSRVTTKKLVDLENKIKENMKAKFSDPNWIINDLLAHIPLNPDFKEGKLAYITHPSKYQDTIEKLNLKKDPFKDKIKIIVEDRGYYCHKEHMQYRPSRLGVQSSQKDELLQQYAKISQPTPTLKEMRKKKCGTTFECIVYYPTQFQALRQVCCDGEDDFVESLSRCEAWSVTGGKSSATFAKTWDDRYTLKFVQQREFSMFLRNAEKYFEHMARWHKMHYPSLLVSILGVFQVIVKRPRQATIQKFVLVMPNLWFGKNIARVFDLKGSTRNRRVGEDSERQRDGSEVKVQKSTQ